MSTALIPNLKAKEKIREKKEVSLNIKIFTEDYKQGGTIANVTERWEKKYPWDLVKVKQKGDGFEIQIHRIPLSTKDHILKAQSEASFFIRGIASSSPVGGSSQ